MAETNDNVVRLSMVRPNQKKQYYKGFTITAMYDREGKTWNWAAVLWVPVSSDSASKVPITYKGKASTHTYAFAAARRKIGNRHP